MDQQQLAIRNIVRRERMVSRETETKGLRTLRMLLAGEQDRLFASHRTDTAYEN
jgi:hypothetical protein